jgi:hypothetical protein
MPYLTCPNCRFSINQRYAHAVESCPRCLASENRRVQLEARLGGSDRDGRLFGTVREEIARRQGSLGGRQPAV